MSHPMFTSTNYGAELWRRVLERCEPKVEQISTGDLKVKLTVWPTGWPADEILIVSGENAVLVTGIGEEA